MSTLSTIVAENGLDGGRVLVVVLVERWTRDSWSTGGRFDSRPGRYQVNQVNSAFHSSGYR